MFEILNYIRFNSRDLSNGNLVYEEDQERTNGTVVEITENVHNTIFKNTNNELSKQMFEILEECESETKNLSNKSSLKKIAECLECDDLD
ncbi:hypothetical protein BpHYR1_034299 [Brachionus plicatilis]|uniref:Uncharacterized protein n=1 Tax=Brachionus plicatilis TaxID=10195 RepID=A0A3M7RV25_BRAPC|nr:hypothetical protein BpHYR1_034299 [Brachionus plicatilis]